MQGKFNVRLFHAEESFEFIIKHFLVNNFLCIGYMLGVLYCTVCSVKDLHPEGYRRTPHALRGMEISNS